MDVMGMKWYILKDRVPIPTDLQTAALWLDSRAGEEVVAKTKIGDAEVSTVFLALDHDWTNTSPQLFETMVFGGVLDGAQRRYATWSEAEAGHAQVVAEVGASQRTELTIYPSKEPL